MARTSTWRLRATQLLFLLTLAAVALTGGRALEGTPGVLAQALGFLLVIGGTLWRIWTSAFIAGRKEIELLEYGPYARCRHPLYFGSFAVGLGLGLTTRSVVVTAVLLISLGVAFWLAIRSEDRFLADRHGEAWAAFRRRVPAFWPRSGPAPMPDGRVVDLRIFRKAFLDGASVLFLWLLLVVLDTLRMQGAWQTWFRLP